MKAEFTLSLIEENLSLPYFIVDGMIEATMCNVVAQYFPAARDGATLSVSTSPTNEAGEKEIRFDSFKGVFITFEHNGALVNERVLFHLFRHVLNKLGKGFFKYEDAVKGSVFVSVK